MSKPKGFPHGLDFTGCLEVTVVLRDFQTLTGRIRGVLGERFTWDDYIKDMSGDPFKKGHKDDKDHKEPKCCEPPKVDVDVEIEEDTKFLLLELTRTAAAASLSSVTCIITGGAVTGVTLAALGTTFPVGACLAINVENILYAGPSATFCEVPITITL
ncbi:hypothetical protein [Anaeroselena agilis]|uniref:Uncharacterized protein n=1 Tax=Anaeroselena agilis TaxID=3063788 RepID=A0ABU3NUG7_9FIRM|nr:hypothetical protein [Selenomonadales bacterium 4137-cl]